MWRGKENRRLSREVYASIVSDSVGEKLVEASVEDTKAVSKQRKNIIR